MDLSAANYKRRRETCHHYSGEVSTRDSQHRITICLIMFNEKSALTNASLAQGLEHWSRKPGVQSSIL